MVLTIRKWALLALPIVAVLASCTLAPDHCITMSDCSDGTMCVEGLCESTPAVVLSADANTSEVGTDGSMTPISSDATTATDAGQAADASDSGDAEGGAMADAAPDN